MEQPDQLLVGALIGINLTAWRVPREGWCVRARYSYEWAPEDHEHVDKYDRLTRGEMVQLLDDLKDAANVGTEY